MLPAIGIGLGIAARVAGRWGLSLLAGSGSVLTGAAGVIVRAIGVGAARIAVFSLASGLTQLLVSTGAKIASFGVTLLAIKLLLQQWLVPFLQDVVARWPSVYTPVRHAFQLMHATQQLIPWGEFFLLAKIFLDFMFLLLVWRLAMWAYALASKVVGSITG